MKISAGNWLEKGDAGQGVAHIADGIYRQGDGPSHGQFLSGNAEAGVTGAVAPFQKIHDGKHAAVNDQQKENVPAHIQFKMPGGQAVIKKLPFQGGGKLPQHHRPGTEVGGLAPVQAAAHMKGQPHQEHFKGHARQIQFHVYPVGPEHEGPQCQQKASLNQHPLPAVEPLGIHGNVQAGGEEVGDHIIRAGSPGQIYLHYLLTSFT